MPEGTKLEATVTLGVNCKCYAYLLPPSSVCDNLEIFMRIATPVFIEKSVGRMWRIRFSAIKYGDGRYITVHPLSYWFKFFVFAKSKSQFVVFVLL